MADLNLVKLENDQSSSNRIRKRKLSTTHYSPRHIPSNLEVIDLTEDNCCFVCDKVLSSCSYYALTSAVTNTSKTYIAQKLGEVIGKSYIILISDDDYICQTCFNLFNKLDNIEIQLQLARTNITECIQQTYGNQVNKTNKIPGHVYKALQMIVDKKDDINRPPQKKSCHETDDTINKIESLDCKSLQCQRKNLTSTKRIVQSCMDEDLEQSLITDYKYQSVESIKENVMQSQDKDLKHYDLSNINNNSSPMYPLLYNKRDTLHTIESIKVEHKINKSLKECQKILTETNVCTKTNLSYTEWNINNGI